MPVRSLTSSVLRWPDLATVHQALRHWAQDLAARCPEVLRVGCFGSYARGDWGVGSDLDVLVIVATTQEPFERRSLRYHADALPVPADLLVYTPEEWDSLPASSGFARTIRAQVIWVYEKPPAASR